MVDFPTNPISGQIYAAEGSVFQYTIPDDPETQAPYWRTLSSGDLITIMESENLWFVTGDKMVQMGGTKGSTSGGVTIPFHVGFDPTQTVTVTASRIAAPALGEFDVDVSGVSDTDFTAATKNSNAFVEGSFYWQAIGTAPDELKKPKQIGNPGGVYFEEYHDPAGVASWRIMGETLECWGYINGDPSGVVTVNFPKTFGGPVRGGCTPFGQNVNFVGSLTADFSTTDVVINSVNESGAPAARGAYWHAIGQWDGVS